MALREPQEDGVIMKASFIERGGLMCATSTYYRSEAANPTSMFAERFEKPDAVLARKTHSYEALTESGLAGIGTKIQGEMMIIGKTQSKLSMNTQEKKTTQTRRCISTANRMNDAGIIRDARIMSLPTGKRVFLHMERLRPIHKADKITIRGAKSVVVSIRGEEDMPFSPEGITPDIVCSNFGPYARQIMSLLIEATTTKAVCVAADLELGIDPQIFEPGYYQQHMEKVQNVLRDPMVLIAEEKNICAMDVLESR